MSKISILLGLLLLVNFGCKSSRIVGLRDSDAQVYHPGVPQDATAAAKSLQPLPSVDAESQKKITDGSSLHLVSAKKDVTDSESDAAKQNPGSGLSIQQSVSLALSQNPDLITLRQSESVSQGALGVAQTYPFNPFLQVQATPYQHAKTGGPGTTYHYVLLMQTIQLAHQQQYREQGAASVLNSTRWNIHQAELLAVAATERLYFAALYQHGITELAEASDRNNRQLLRILEDQLDAGQATAADVAIVRVDAASTRQQLQLASANYQAAIRDLARQVGVSPDSVQYVDGRLQDVDWRIPGAVEGTSIAAEDFDFSTTADSRSNIMSWASSRPDVMVTRSDIDVARASLNLASASKTPDLQIGPYYQTTADGTNFLGFRGQIDLPVVNNGEPLERQRSAEHRQRCVAWQQAQRRAELEAEAAFDRYQTALAAVTENFGAVGSDLPAALEGLENQFLEGEVDIIRVVQARNSLIQNQRSRLDLLNEVAQSAAVLTGATGIPMDDVFQM